MCPFFLSSPSRLPTPSSARPASSAGGGTPSHCRTRMNFRPGLRAAAHPLWGISPRRPRTCECYAEPIGTQVVRGACETLWKWREDLQTEALKPLHIGETWQPAQRFRDKGILAPETYPV